MVFRLLLLWVYAGCRLVFGWRTRLHRKYRNAVRFRWDLLSIRYFPISPRSAFHWYKRLPASVLRVRVGRFLLPEPVHSNRDNSFYYRLGLLLVVFLWIPVWIRLTWWIHRVRLLSVRAILDGRNRFLLPSARRIRTASSGILYYCLWYLRIFLGDCWKSVLLSILEWLPAA